MISVSTPLMGSPSSLQTWMTTSPMHQPLRSLRMYFVILPTAISNAPGIEAICNAVREVLLLGKATYNCLGHILMFNSS